MHDSEKPCRLPAPLRDRAARAMAPALVVLAGLVLSTAPATAAADIAAWMLFDARTGEVLARENAFQPWAPASVTKLMTTYVTLQALRSGRVRPTSPVVVSALANTQPPSKMGFPTGTVVTIDNALKIIMVKSANDIAWAIGEALSGSQAAFVDEMNATARRLGMSATHFVNSNGLPAEGQVTNAHDLGLLARALIVEFPDRSDLFSISALQFGKRRIANHNDLLERFPGSDGMKTGFICASGYNVVATATRGGRRLVAVVLGARSGRVRAEKAAELFTKGFAGENMLGWFARSENLHAMTIGSEISNPVGNLKEIVCGKGRSGEEETAQGEGAPAAEAQKVSYLSPRQPPAAPVKIWIGGAELPAGQSQIAAVQAPVKAGAAQVMVRAPGSLVPQPAKASPIDQSFDLFKAQQAAQPGAKPAPQPAAGQQVKLSPIIEDLPEPEKPAKKARKTKVSQKKIVPKPKS